MNNLILFKIKVKITFSNQTIVECNAAMKKPLIISESCLRILKFFSEPRGGVGVSRRLQPAQQALGSILAHSSSGKPPRSKPFWYDWFFSQPQRSNRRTLETKVVLTKKTRVNHPLELLCSFRYYIFKTFFGLLVRSVRCDI